MADKKESSLGLAIFLYFIVLIVICVIAYNLYFSLVFINYDITGDIKTPAGCKSLPETLWFGYASLYLPLAGNTPACNVVAVAIPVLVILVIAASINLTKHFVPDEIIDDIDDELDDIEAAEITEQQTDTTDTTDTTDQQEESTDEA